MRIVFVPVPLSFRARAAWWFEKQRRAAVVRAMGRCMKYQADIVVRMVNARR